MYQVHGICQGAAGFLWSFGMSIELAGVHVEARPVTQGPSHHFFGYYDKFPWDASGRWMLGLRTAFMDRPPQADDVAIVGVIDTENENKWTTLAETRAWNWQQGCMLQWLAGGPEIFFNDRIDGQFICHVLNVNTGHERIIPRPIYTVNRSAKLGISLNFARLHDQRPGYGYAGVPDPSLHRGEPEDDGLWAVDLESGKSRLILSLAEAAEFERQEDFLGKTHRFNHVQFGARDDRFSVLHRYKPEALNKVGETRLLTLNTDGTELCCLSQDGYVSHYDWRGGASILAWASEPGLGRKYYLFQDGAKRAEIIGAGVLTTDGHCSFSPDGRWVLTDTYPDTDNYRTLLLYHFASGERVDIGRFFSPPVDWQIRCDLHPRWNRDGTQVCIDSVHEGARKMYVLDVASIVESR